VKPEEWAEVVYRAAPEPPQDASDAVMAWYEGPLRDAIANTFRLALDPEHPPFAWLQKDSAPTKSK
jgi:hypothetical protein